MGLLKYIPFDFRKLSKALKKDWKEVERQQNKMGFEAFMQRRGTELSRSNPVVGIVKPSKSTQLFRKSSLMKQTPMIKTNFIE